MCNSTYEYMYGYSFFYSSFTDVFIQIFIQVYAYGSKTVLIKRTFLLMGRGGLCWGGVGGGRGGGVHVLSSAYSTYFYAPEISGMLAMLHVATLPRSLECLPRYMLLRCRDLWNACHVTCCYAAEISGMLATLHVATLPRSLECFPRCMLLRCRDLWNACHFCVGASHKDFMLYAKMWQWRFVNEYKNLLQKTADMLHKLE